MGTALSLVAENGHRVPPGSTLAILEQKLADAMCEQYEAFYRQGVILEEIKGDPKDPKKQPFRNAGYSSFNDYLKERQPLGINRTHGWRLIAAKNIRHLLPTFESPNGDSGLWTEGAIRHLTRKEFSPSDVKRLGKKIATQVKRGEKLTADLVKRVCDEDLGVPKQKARRHAERLAATETPAQIMQRLKVEVELWHKSLEEFPASFWDDAEQEDRGCTKRAIAALSDLASFLRS